MKNKDVFEDLKTSLQLSYISDIRFCNKKKAFDAAKKMQESGEYSDKDMESLFDYIFS